MQKVQPSVLARDHTLLGICEALGEDFGFNPVFLRIALSLALFFSPVGAIAVYAGLGLLVAFTRFVAPNPKPAAPAEPEVAQCIGAVAETCDAPEMALAA